MNEHLSYSQAGFAMTRGFEGLRLKAYNDGIGVLTIGYGHTKGIGEGDTCFTAGAEKWLREDVAEAERIVRAQIMCDLNQGQFDALVDFVFNVGGGNLYISDIRKALNCGDIERAANGFSHFTKAGGKVMKGLVKRREAERKMFIGEAQNG